MEDHPLIYLKSWGLKDPPDRLSVIRAYRKRAQKLHPDRSGNTPQANEQFIQLRHQYQLLLKYSSDPGSFTPPSNNHHTYSTPPSSRPTPVAPIHPSLSQAWVVPPGNLTLRKSWPLNLAWSGGSLLLGFSRGIPCGCQVGCQNCRGTLMRVEAVSVQVSVPPLPSPRTRVRLPRMGHRGDMGLVGTATIELSWTGMRAWRWKQDILYTTIRVPRRTPWVYCRAPDAQWYRLSSETPSYEWVSPVGLRAVVKIKPSSRIMALPQSWYAMRWAFSRSAPFPSRVSLSLSAILKCWRSTM